MFFATIGITAAGKSGFLAAGTFISSSCTTTSGTDAQGTLWNGSWTLTSYYADGMGGSYSSNAPDNTAPCYYPNGYVSRDSSITSSLNWTAGNGATGVFTYYQAWDYDTQNGAGGFSNFTGGFSYSAGYAFHTYSTSSGTYTLFYDGGGGYYESFTPPAAGTFLFAWCAPADIVDAAGTTWNTNADHTYVYADGNGGSYSVLQGRNSNGCWYPAGFVMSVDESNSSLTYQDENFNNQSWTYATSGTIWTAQGDGTQINTIYSTQEAAGTVFYSHSYSYSGTTNWVTYYHYDGGNGYYTTSGEEPV